MIVAVSAKIKDRRVDGILKGMGLNSSDCEIFYSPIAGFLFYFLILIAFVIPIFFLTPVVIFNYPYHFLIYATAKYLILAYMNNSYVIYHKQLIVINPNFPFRSVKIYEIDQIEKIVINNRLSFFTWVFLIFCPNYIEVHSNRKTQRFYSIYLEEDYFDENITEKTLDDFNSALNKMHVPTDFHLNKN